MFDSPFRQEAAASRNERQQLDHLLRITAPNERVILAGIVAVLVGFVAWALVGSVERAVTFDGVLIEPGARLEVVSTEPGQLIEVLVAPGDSVAAGDPIARQTVPELDRETEMLRERVDVLQAEILGAGGEGTVLRALLASTNAALLQMEARRASRASIVSHSAGEVTALYAAPGDYLPGSAAVALLREVTGQPPLAVLQVVPDMAQRIRPGMRATVEFTMPGGGTRRLQGEVASITSRLLPGWLAALLPAVNEPRYRVDIAVHERPGLSVPDGTVGRIRIELGRDSPAALLAHGSS